MILHSKQSGTCIETYKIGHGVTKDVLFESLHAAVCKAASQCMQALLGSDTSFGIKEQHPCPRFKEKAAEALSALESKWGGRDDGNLRKDDTDKSRRVQNLRDFNENDSKNDGTMFTCQRNPRQSLKVIRKFQLFALIL